MKKACLFFILLYIQNVYATNLYDRLKTQQLWSQTVKALNTEKIFDQELKRADLEKRKRTLSLGTHLQYIFPGPLIESYLTWRILRPNDKKAIDVLKYALLYRLLLLRDVIDSPLSTDEQVKKAKNQLTQLTQISELTSQNIWNLTHELIDHKARVLHKIQDDEVLALALKETPWLGQQFHIPNITRYVLSPLGYLKGNSQNWVPVQDIPSDFENSLSQLKSRLIIESNVMVQYPELTTSLQKNIQKNKNNSLEYHIIFHTPQDKNSLVSWEDFRNKNDLSARKLNFIVRPQAVDDPLPTAASLKVEAAPLFPRELDPIFSQGGLISFDPTSKNPKTILTGALSVPRGQALSLRGPAAAAFVLASEISVVKNWITEIQDVDQSLKQNETVRPARISSDLNVQEIRPMLIDMISKAEESIYIDQFFLFDAHVVQSLIKRKIQLPELDVRLLMDHNLNYSMGGFPNTLFLADMIEHGLKIKSRKESKSNSSLIVVDNKTALIGPQNLIPTQLNLESTLQVAQVFGSEFLAPRVQEFKSDWQDTSNLYEFNIKNFRFTTPTEVLSKDDSKLLNAIGAEFLRQKD